MPRTGARGLTFHHPAAFWAGTAAVAVGVALHLPMYLGARALGTTLTGLAGA